MSPADLRRSVPDGSAAVGSRNVLRAQERLSGEAGRCLLLSPPSSLPEIPREALGLVSAPSTSVSPWGFFLHREWGWGGVWATGVLPDSPQGRLPHGQVDTILPSSEGSMTPSHSFRPNLGVFQPKPCRRRSSGAREMETQQWPVRSPGHPKGGHGDGGTGEDVLGPCRHIVCV